jgi:hypothetical protein
VSGEPTIFIVCYLYIISYEFSPNLKLFELVALDHSLLFSLNRLLAGNLFGFLLRLVLHFENTDDGITALVFLDKLFNLLFDTGNFGYLRTARAFVEVFIE